MLGHLTIAETLPRICAKAAYFDIPFLVLAWYTLSFSVPEGILR